MQDFELTDDDWELLDDYCVILEVWNLLRKICVLTQVKVPHAFQHMLGSTSTPTLPYTVVAFSSLMKRWNEIQASNVDWFDIIQPGLEKLKAYEEELMKTPAYIVAMGKHSKIMPSLALGSYDFPAIDPNNKLTHYYSKTSQHEYENAKKIFVKAVSKLKS